MTPTREKILDAAISLFAEHGYTETPMRAIAERVNIKPASIYNHFTSKAEILDVIFKFYTDNIAEHTIGLKDVEKQIEHEDAKTIISRMFYVFETADSERLLNILKIIMHEQFREPRVRAYVRDVMILGTQRYIEDILNSLIRAGKLSPAVDSGVYARLFNSVLINSSMEVLHYSGEDRIATRGRSPHAENTLKFLTEQIINTK